MRQLKQQLMNHNKSTKRIGLFKRLLVMIYDGLLLVSLLFFTSAIWIGLFNLLAPESLYVDSNNLKVHKLASFTDLGRTIGFSVVAVNIVAVSFFFYGWFWTHGGQTLGMKAWHLYITKPDGKFIGWPLAAKRYACALLSWACLGLGFLWVLFHPQRKTWHDLLTDTQMVYHRVAEPKKST